MIDPNTKLSILHDEAGFTDRTNDAADYGRDEFDFAFTAAGFLYIGFEKPFHAAYVEMNTADDAGASFTAEYHNGTAFTTLDSFQDETKAMSRSGFFRWVNPEDWAASTVNGTEKYWIRISTDTDFNAATKIQGLSLVFSDDQELKKLFAAVLNSEILPVGYSSHILSHVVARDAIIQKLRNQNYVIRENSASGGQKLLTMWDLLNIEEIRTAATYKALAQIYFDISDSDADVYFAKYEKYERDFQNLSVWSRLTLDVDNDGEIDPGENLQESKTVRISR